MSFEKDKYIVIKEAIPKKVAEFVYNYFLMKRQVARTLFNSRYISQFSDEWGTWKDPQVPNTYSHYADVAMETLLLMVQGVMEKHTKLKLNPTYSYARIYKAGDVLKKHKDRFSCEISTTLNLGGDMWPIHLRAKNKDVRINLKPGDMLVYRGIELEHWREEFQGDNCAQVFLHYNDEKSKDSNKNIYDTREHLGLPSWFKK
jgi:alkylated DNA repair dioxygenase AlkB